MVVVVVVDGVVEGTVDTTVDGREVRWVADEEDL